MRTTQKDDVFKHSQFNDSKLLYTETNKINLSDNIINYRIEKTIGEGTFGKVKLGYHIQSNEKVAIKVLEKHKILEPEDLERVNREIRFLKKLKNKNIIKIYEIVENLNNYYIIMEYASGGELFNYIVNKKRLVDDEACFFFYQIINGLDYIHKNNIVHRDLKPENLLLNDKKVIKIIDFGLSNQYKQSQLLVTPCGSPCYAAPEMILGKMYSGIQVDIWSTGIILYAMVCGFLPFEDKSNEKLYKKITECKLEFPNFVSNFSRNFIRKLLTVNPAKRIKLEEIKENEYYKLGEKLMNNDKQKYDKAGLNNKILEKMTELGFSIKEVMYNIEKNKHNNITTTFQLLKKKYKNAFIGENLHRSLEFKLNESQFPFKKSNELNKNINININYSKNSGNININITEPCRNSSEIQFGRISNNLNNKSKNVLMQNDSLEKIEYDFNKNSTEYNEKIDKLPSHYKIKSISKSNSPIIMNNNDVKKYPENKIDNLKSKNEESFSKRVTTTSIAELSKSVDINKAKVKLSDYLQQKNYIKTSIINNKLNDSYIEKTNSKNKNKRKHDLTSSLDKHKKNVSSNKSNYNTNYNNITSRLSEINPNDFVKKNKKISQKLLEYPNKNNEYQKNNELNYPNDIKLNDFKHTKNILNDFKKKLTNLSLYDPKAQEVKQIKNPQGFNNIALTEIHERVHPANTSKNEDRLKYKNNSITSKKESFISFKPETQSNQINHYNLTENIVPSTTKNKNTQTFNNNLLVKDNNTSYSQLITEQSCNKFSKNEFRIAEKNSEDKSKNIENYFFSPKTKSYSNKLTNSLYNSKITLTQPKTDIQTMYKLNENNNKSDLSHYQFNVTDGNTKIETENENLPTNQRRIIKNNPSSKKEKLSESVRKIQNSNDFACCTINYTSQIQEKLSKYCESSNILLKNVCPNKYECRKDGYSIGVEFITVGLRGMKFLKLYHISGDIKRTKDMIKNFIINLGI